MTATMSNEANLNLNTNDKMFPRAKCRWMNVVLIEYLTKTSDRDKLRGLILSPIHDPCSQTQNVYFPFMFQQAEKAFKQSIE